MLKLVIDISIYMQQMPSADDIFRLDLLIKGIHIFSNLKFKNHAQIQRGGGGTGGPDPPEKSQKYRVS